MTLVSWLTDIIGLPEPSMLEVIFLMSGFLGTAFFLILMTMMMLGDIVKISQIALLSEMVIG